MKLLSQQLSKDKMAKKLMLEDGYTNIKKVRLSAQVMLKCLILYASVSQPPVRGLAPVRVYFSASPPNKFQHYITIQKCAFYYNPLGYARSIFPSSANIQVYAVCTADSFETMKEQKLTEWWSLKKFFFEFFMD